MAITQFGRPVGQLINFNAPGTGAGATLPFRFRLLKGVKPAPPPAR